MNNLSRTLTNLPIVEKPQKYIFRQFKIRQTAGDICNRFFYRISAEQQLRNIKYCIFVFFGAHYLQMRQAP